MAQAPDHYERCVTIGADGSVTYEYFSVRWVWTGDQHTATGRISTHDLSRHHVSKGTFDKAVRAGAKTETTARIHRSVPVDMFPPLTDPGTEGQ